MFNLLAVSWVEQEWLETRGIIWQRNANGAIMLKHLAKAIVILLWDTRLFLQIVNEDAVRLVIR